jgi:hypothetical protein
VAQETKIQEPDQAQREPPAVYDGQSRRKRRRRAAGREEGINGGCGGEEGRLPHMTNLLDPCAAAPCWPFCQNKGDYTRGASGPALVGSCAMPISVKIGGIKILAGS